MNTREHLTQEEVSALLTYEPETGVFRWKERPKEMFSIRECDCGIWNKNNAGKVAGSKTNRGYLRIKIGGVPYLSHRLAWLLMTGAWPELEIDHINGIKTDNRWLNLRAADRIINLANMGLYKNNRSGIHGVIWVESKARYEVSIQRFGKTHYLGRYTDFFEACCTRKSAECAMGFHANHGRAA